MKKVLTLMVVALLTATAAMAGKRTTFDVSVLPQEAQATLSKYFPGKGVNHITIDKGVFSDTDYDVVLDNGNEIEFNKKGEWTEVDCGYGEVPAGFLPPSVSKYVKQNFSKQKIVKVERKRNKYEIELANGLDLEFDRAGNFLRAD